MTRPSVDLSVPSNVAVVVPPRPSGRWLARRALLAMAVTAGFYGFAVATILVLLWIPYAEATYLRRLSLQLAIFCVGSAITVLAAVWPRRDRFDPPGPRLSADEQPMLFQMIQEVAEATRQPMPADVYLVNEVNAWVAQRGGTLGFGGRRVMGIGLPLLQALSVDELRAVVAHEFGHYMAHDVRFGPWIYKTRAAIGRTIQQLEENIVGKLFEWYGRKFVDLTAAISRQQEFVADEVAARTTSPALAARALERVAAAGPAFAAYFGHEVMPVVSSGYLPPLAGGFAIFLQSPRVTRAMGAVTQSEAERATQPFDSHPPLGERLAALQAIAARDVGPVDARSAAELVGDLEALARSLLAFGNGEQVLARLEAVEWSDVPDRVYVARWRDTVATFAAPLAGLTAEGLGAGPASFVAIGRQLVQPGESLVDRDAAIQRGLQVVGAAVAVMLLDSGWTLAMEPGEGPRFGREDESVNPFELVFELASGQLPILQWQTRCAALGISGRSLAPAAACA